MIKGSIQKEAITLVNITLVNICNIGAPKYKKQMVTDIKGETDRNTIVRDFNTSLTPMDRSSRYKNQ